MMAGLQGRPFKLFTKEESMSKRILFAAVAALFADPAAAQQVTFMTGPQGGVWVPLGGAL